MDDVEIKAIKYIELKRKRKNLKRLTISAIITFALAAGMTAKTIYDYKALNPEDLDETILQLTDGEYGDYVNSMQDKYCEDFCNGDITSEEYGQLCRCLKSEEGLVEWAKTLHDEEVDGAINLYNMAKRDRVLTTMGNVSLAIAFGLSAGILSTKALDTQFEYKKGKEEYDKKYKDKDYWSR